VAKYRFLVSKIMHTSFLPAVPTAEYWKLSKEERDRVEAESKPIKGMDAALKAMHTTHIFVVVFFNSAGDYADSSPAAVPTADCSSVKETESLKSI
jgi:hypothetical protein